MTKSKKHWRLSIRNDIGPKICIRDYYENSTSVVKRQAKETAKLYCRNNLKAQGDVNFGNWCTSVDPKFGDKALFLVTVFIPTPRGKLNPVIFILEEL